MRCPMGLLLYLPDSSIPIVTFLAKWPPGYQPRKSVVRAVPFTLGIQSVTVDNYLYCPAAYSHLQ